MNQFDIEYFEKMRNKTMPPTAQECNYMSMMNRNFPAFVNVVEELVKEVKALRKELAELKELKENK